MSKVEDIFGKESSFVSELPDTTNDAGYKAYSMEEKEEYVKMLVANTIRNAYYTDRDELLERAQKKHKEMVEKDPEFMAKALVYARNKGYMRLQPIFGLTEFVENYPEKLKKWDLFQQVCRIPSDIFEFMTIMKSKGHGTCGRAVKRQINNFLNEKLSEYWALKYNGRGRGFNLTDLIRISHPHPKNNYKDKLFNYLATDGDGDKWNEFDKNKSNITLKKIHYYEAAKQWSTEYRKREENNNLTESFKKDYEDKILEYVDKGQLPRRTVTSIAKMTPKMWETLLYDMPVFEMLRHLSTFEKNGLFEKIEVINHIRNRLTDKKTIKNAKILPFRFAKAFDYVNNYEIRDILREGVENSLVNIPELPGETAIFLDVSGSMGGGYEFGVRARHEGETANLFAFALYKKSNCPIFLKFNNSVQEVRPSRADSILTQAKELSPMGGTSAELPVRKIRQNNRLVDNIIMITDQQQQQGDSFYSELKRYRRTVNKDVKTFIVDVGTHSGNMTPPSDENTYYCFGWSSNILKYIPQQIRGFDGMIDEVENVSL